ncbi:hypothetical protein [Sorangium sp. So ce117]
MPHPIHLPQQKTAWGSAGNDAEVTTRLARSVVGRTQTTSRTNLVTYR